MTLTVGTRLGPYEIEEGLGAGGMGEVYRARDSKLGRAVAIKILPPHFVDDPERRARFAREARVLATLNHPHIGAIYGLEESDGITGLVLELVEGPTLAERLKRGPLPVGDALTIARQMAEALAAAHDKGIVHRDLKPANIVLQDGAGLTSSETVVKVLDFGLAKAITPSDGVDVTQQQSDWLEGSSEGRILGTPAYMSPEQARGLRVDKRADIWAFGCVLFEMLTGRRAFDGETLTDTLAQILEHEPDWSALPAATTTDTRRVLMRCLRKDPRKRLQDIGDAAIELDDVGTELRTDVGRPWPRRRWHFVTAFGLLALASAAIYGFVASILSPSRDTKAPVAISSIVPPPGIQFNFVEEFEYGPPAISPDGQYVTYSAKRTNGEIALFLRPLNASETESLAGTEGGLYPFWSPDSEYIAFFSAGRLRKLSLSARIVTDIIPAGIGNGRGGTWNKRGIIIFTPDYYAPLRKVSAAGGEVTDATRLDQSRGEMSNRFPWFLPDGRHFLYTAQRPIGFYNRSTVRLASLDSAESQVLFDADSNVVYANGFLLYVRENSETLVARPFDPSALKVTGEPLTVADGVRTINLTSCGVFSVSENGRLIYQAGARTGSQLVWVDRKGNRSTAAGLERRMNVSFIHFSPDRKYLAANIQSPTGLGSDIWVYDVARGALMPVTTDGRRKRNVIWSPDGKTLAYDAARTPGGPHDIYIRAVDGSGSEQWLLSGGEFSMTARSWARNALLLYDVRSRSDRDDGYVVPVTAQGAGKPAPILNGRDARFGLFSPDGQWISYQSSEGGNPSIWLTSFPNSGRRIPLSTLPGSNGCWRPDGKEYFYVARQQLMAVDVSIAGDDVQVGVPSPLPIRLRSTGGYTYDVSSDGQRFLAVLADDETTNEPLTLMQNWTTRLSQQLSSGGGHNVR